MTSIPLTSGPGYSTTLEIEAADAEIAIFAVTDEDDRASCRHPIAFPMQHRREVLTAIRNAGYPDTVAGRLAALGDELDAMRGDAVALANQADAGEAGDAMVRALDAAWRAVRRVGMVRVGELVG